MTMRMLGRKVAARPPRRSPTTTSILIVDDSATMRVLLRTMLLQLGYRNVEEAEDGETALKKIHVRPYDLIISDWHMAPMNGVELLKKVKLIRKGGQNKFIFSTSESGWSSQTTAKLEGAEAFITKPFTVDLLRQKIDLVLTR